MKDITSKSVSRRTVAKGAAWAVPAIAVGSAAAAEGTVSPEPGPDPVVTCPEDPADLCFYTQMADVITNSRVIGTDTADGSGRKGSSFDMRLGTWQFDTSCMPKAYFPDGSESKITGYKVNWPSAATVVVRGVTEDDTNGALGVSHKWVQGPTDHWGNNSWKGHLTLGPNSLPLVVGAGLAFTTNLQTTMPYSGWAADPEFGTGGKGEPYRRVMISIPLSITFLKGIKPIIHTPNNVESCGSYYMNLVMESGIGGTTYRVFRAKGPNHKLWGPHEMWLSRGLPELPAAPAA